MSQINETLVAGVTKRFEIAGRFFRLVRSGGQVNISFFRDKQRIDETVTDVTTGFYFRGDFDGVELYSATGDTINAITSMGEVGYSDSVNVAGGEVAIDAWATTPSQAAATVTNASGNLLAANAARKYLLIQNKDSSGNIFVNLAGATATTANGIKIFPGGFLELPAHWCPQGIITAIGDIASNANIVVVEG